MSRQRHPFTCLAYKKIIEEHRTFKITSVIYLTRLQYYPVLLLDICGVKILELNAQPSLTIKNNEARQQPGNSQQQDKVEQKIGKIKGFEYAVGACGNRTSTI